MSYKTGWRRYTVLCAVVLTIFGLYGGALKVSARDASAKVLMPSAPGTQAFSAGSATLDISNASEGYVMLNYSGNNPKVKFRITTPEGTNYTYLVSEYNKYVAYPLSGGNGNYTFAVYEVASEKDNLYAAVLSRSAAITVTNGMSPFLYPNYYVNFNASSTSVQKGVELARGCSTDLDVVTKVYHYATDNITYDYNKAKTVQSGYAPSPDATLAAGTGICFDYSSLVAAMLRSQGIPTRLEVGYVGKAYHAWISCYITDIGWVDDIMQFDGKKWTMMDPTMAAGQSKESFKKFFKNSTYSIKYLY